MDFQIVFPGNGRKEPDSLWKTILIGRQLLPKRQNRTNPEVRSSTRASDPITLRDWSRENVRDDSFSAIPSKSADRKS
jgi:hypothetical protein